ncbi:YggT family protein [Egibacter rhizosphaerae]|uniref:YggT family protein n=1 Tax=Egibacter rhizosphaerae TaxID=1670831 RepID=A0A411YA99_9ACTN|nr:YggT family protein [Egibacter rhizosphaerae]QBI18126.1 YggT family protein [Egibacter rhizosphaerae]
MGQGINPFGIFCTALTIYYIILLVRIILSWVPSLPDALRPVADFVYLLTDPVLRPVRGLLPPLRIGGVGLDLSPIIVFIVISWIIQPIVCRLTGGGLF